MVSLYGGYNVTIHLKSLKAFTSKKSGKKPFNTQKNTMKLLRSSRQPEKHSVTGGFAGCCCFGQQENKSGTNNSVDGLACKQSEKENGVLPDERCV